MSPADSSCNTRYQALLDSANTCQLDSCGMTYCCLRQGYLSRCLQCSLDKYHLM